MRLAFVVPAHRRFELTQVCLRQLRRTCDQLARHGIHASAFVVGDDRNLRTARNLGFGTVRQDNTFLGRKFNDGFQVACDPQVNPRPADYAMPYGTDDWIDHRILLNLPRGDTVLAFQHLCVVRPDGREMSARYCDNLGGPGLRVYPRHLLEKTGFRPADEDRNRGCDTSTLANLRRVTRVNIMYRDIDPRQIVDWKSPDVQVTPYTSVAWRRTKQTWDDPFTALAGLYPTDSLEEMRTLY